VAAAGLAEVRGGCEGRGEGAAVVVADSPVPAAVGDSHELAASKIRTLNGYQFDTDRGAVFGGAMVVFLVKCLWIRPVRVDYFWI